MFLKLFSKLDIKCMGRLRYFFFLEFVRSWVLVNIESKSRERILLDLRKGSSIEEK